MKKLILTNLSKFTLGLVVSIALIGCGGPIDKIGMNEIRNSFEKPIYLVVPDEDSRATYKKWSAKKSDRGLIGTAYSFRTNHDTDSGLYKFLEKHDLLFSRNVSPPSRVGNPSFKFTFFRPKIKYLFRDVIKKEDLMSFGGSKYYYNVPVGMRNLNKVYDIEIETDMVIGGQQIREYNFAFTYELESTHPLFEAPCKKYNGTGKISSYGKKEWEVGYLDFEDKEVNEFLSEQECRAGNAFDFPDSSFNKKDYEAVREKWSQKAELQISGDNTIVTNGPVVDVLKETANKLRTAFPDNNFSPAVIDRVFESQAQSLEVFPTGSVHLTTGIIPLLENEEGLSAVIAHGLGHTIAGHDLTRMVENDLSPLDEALALETSPIDVMEALGTGSQYKDIPSYTADQEFEADKEAIKLLSQACYRVSDGMGVFIRLQQDRFKQYTKVHPVDDARKDTWSKLKEIAEHCK